MGGPDAEREVSIASGREVAAALRESGWCAVAEETIDRPSERDLSRLIARHRADVVFPALHGKWGEGGGIQTLLERIGIPYVGSSPAAAALAMDKLATKNRLSPLGVETPEAVALDPDDACTLAPPIVLKPIDDGSSVDLRICKTAASIADARAALHPRRGRLLAERYVTGREVTAGIVAGEALPLIEIVPAVEFYDYAAKYEREDTRYVIDPALPGSAARRCRDAALVAFRSLGCRDLARADFIVDEAGSAWFLEINTMPGFTSHSLVPMAARATGVEMPALCWKLASLALERAAAPASA